MDPSLDFTIEQKQMILREYYRIKQKNYRIAHPEVVNACQRRYYETHKHTGRFKTKKKFYTIHNAKTLEKLHTDPVFAEERRRKQREAYHLRTKLKKEQSALEQTKIVM